MGRGLNVGFGEFGGSLDGSLAVVGLLGDIEIDADTAVPVESKVRRLWRVFLVGLAM